MWKINDGENCLSLFPISICYHVSGMALERLFVTCVSASCTNPGPAVCTLLGLFLCCAMPFAGTGTSPDQDDNVMPVFRDKELQKKCQETENQVI